MKLSTLFLVTFLFSGFAYAQSADSTSAGPQRGNDKKQRMDRFIDVDGDGICDHRARGLGFKHGKHGEGKMNGKNQTDVSGKSTGTGKQYRGGKK